MSRIAVAATAPFGADVLERLAAEHEVALLVTRPDKPRGRGRKVAAPAAKETARALGIPVVQPARLDESVAIPADTVVVAAYGLVVPDALLERGLWLNVHPSLLPRWRGAAPVERALMAGDTTTGVTIHRTTPELDAGPIAAQEAFDIGPDDDAGDVYARAAAIAARLIGGVLSHPEFREQPSDGAMYAEKIAAGDRELDLARSPREIVDHVRALSPHIGARAVVDGVPLVIWKARVADDGSLELLDVQPEGRRRMTYAEYLRGRR